MRFFEYAPFSRVFPMASVLVHHGGIGTMAQSMKAGIPQLIAPWGIDQYDNGARMKALGLGDVISSRTCTAASLAHKLDFLLNAHDIHEQCRKISTRIKTSDPLPDLCDIIEKAGSSTDRSRPSWPSTCSNGVLA
jgi:UDP:flavonoid glycosyltransferase YjiC (YdhE family)